mmetsp:Transcript_54791/g.119300  ORF Transcript_54791/g.119300 Transcript_54791/m.119300 type:complete len:85 (-) Transcript_54791:32-286(-)
MYRGVSAVWVETIAKHRDNGEVVRWSNLCITSHHPVHTNTPMVSCHPPSHPLLSPHPPKSTHPLHPLVYVLQYGAPPTPGTMHF